MLAGVNASHCPRLEELDLQALYIDTTQNFPKLPLPLVAVMLIFVVLMAKLVSGDWATGWGWGSFYVAFTTMLWKRNNHDANASCCP